MNRNTTLPAQSPAGGKHLPIPQLSPIEIRALRYVARHRHSEGFAPSQRDIARALNISPAGAHKLVQRLIDKGAADMTDGKARSLIVICDLRELEQSVGGAA